MPASPSLPHHATPTPSPWLVLVVTTAMQALISGAALTPPVLATEAAADIGLDPHLIGFYTSLVYLGATLTTLFAGAIVASVGAMRVSQICLGLCGLGLVLLTAGVPVLAVLAALVIGFGYGPATPSSSHMLARTTPPERRGLIFSIKQTGVPLGGVLAGTLVPWLVGWFGWQAAAWGIGGGALLLMLAVQPLRGRLDQDLRPTQSFRGWGWVSPLLFVWRQRDLRMMALASCCFAAVQLSFSTYLVTVLVGSLGYSLVVAGAVLAAAQVAGSLGRVIWGILADHWCGARKMLIILSIVMAVTALACAFFSSEWPLWGVLAVAMMLGATAVGWNGVYLAEVAHLAGAADAGRATGGALAFTYGGVVAGPSLFGLAVAVGGGYGFAFAACAVIGLIGGGCVALVSGSQKA